MWGRRARTALFAVVGSLVGLALGARVEAGIGPFRCTVVAQPSLHGATLIRLAPLGSIELDTHTGPVSLELRVDELRQDEAERIAADPDVLEGLEDELAADARSALQALLWRALGVAILGGLLGGVAARASWRSAVAGTACGALIAGSLGVLGATTFSPDAVAEPRYRGLLTVAPRAVGDVEAVVRRFDDYRAQLSGLVGNVVALYRAAEGLPSLDVGRDAVRLLHISDLHNNPQGFDVAAQVAEQFDVDAVVDTGDITDWGTSAESLLADRISDLGVPYLWVRGNHDSRRTQDAVAAEPNAVVLDGRPADVAGIRVWGIGDPRYTPDKDVDDPSLDAEIERIESFARVVESRLADARPATVDIVAVHDARSAAELEGVVPLVLAGHRHRPGVERLGDTIVLTEGSTGGAGLRALQGEEPEPLTCSVLYLDPVDDRLVAYDRITVDGLGGSGVRIERHVVHDG